MRENKKTKFTFLMISIISVSLLIASCITMFGVGIGHMSTSYINKDEWKFIEPNFYKSDRFDNVVLQEIISAIENELIKENNEYYNSEYENYDVESFRNLKYIIAEKSTGKYITNTLYESIDDFEKNINEYVNISINKLDGRYTKKIGTKKNEISTNYYGNGVPYINSGLEVHLSFPKDLMDDDIIFSEFYNYNQNVQVMRIYLFIGAISLFVFLVSTIILKFIKGEAITQDSKILKFYRKIPLEIVVLVLGYLFTLTINWSSYLYMDLLSMIFVILSVFIWISYIVFFIKNLKYLDRKIDILKSSLVYKFRVKIKYIILTTIKASKKMILIKKIGIIGIGCIVINILASMVLGISGAIVGSSITIIGFTAYIIKKLAYTSEIMDGAQRIKSGDLNYKIHIRDDDHFTLLAENINNIGQGLENSIEDALKSERMKAELITNVSHDLKTPLTSIMNYIQLIKKEENIKPDYINDYVQILDSKSKRLKVLIEDLFEASKASSGNIELNMEKIEFKQLLRQSIGEMEEKLLESKLDIKLNMPDDNVYIYADGRRMYRVLENLLTNIIKYSLNDTRVYIDLSVNEGKLVLTMKNISSYELNFDPVEIMERFKRADESRNTEGSGLGLAIAKDLVNLQGGNFKIEIDGDLFKSILEFDEIN